MTIADAALRAAREVNADAIEGTNIPEIYRAAADNLFKAKREYKLKNFDRARKYALKATALAEKAEFESIRSGGATPEAVQAREQSSMEGASADPNWGLGMPITSGMNQEKKTAETKQQSSFSEGPASPPPLKSAEPIDEGTLYTELKNEKPEAAPAPTQQAQPKVAPKASSKGDSEESTDGGDEGF